MSGVSMLVSAWKLLASVSVEFAEVAEVRDVAVVGRPPTPPDELTEVKPDELTEGPPDET